MCDYVCNELMVDIFERLPPKSIIRFRSLSKYWHSSLVSPEFIHDHRIRCSKNPPKVLIRHVAGWGHTRETTYTLHSADRLPLHPGSGYIGIPAVEFPCEGRIDEVVGSCNGILCLRDKDDIILWNLSIRRKLMIPLHPLLLFTLKSRDVAFGFGFDTVTDDYKIVGVSYNICYSLIKKTYIYSLKTDSWSEIPSPPCPFSYVTLNRKPCFINGILHWVVMPEEASPFILTFNLSSQVFGFIYSPDSWNFKQLTTINGCLAMVCLKDGDSWKIQAMGEYDRSEPFTVLFKLKKEALFHVIQPITNGDVLVAYNERSKVYNPRTDSFKKLVSFGARRYNIEMETYVESLELLDNDSAEACGETVFSSR